MAQNDDQSSHELVWQKMDVTVRNNLSQPPIQPHFDLFCLIIHNI